MELKKLSDFAGKDLAGFTAAIFYSVGTSEDGRQFNHKELYATQGLACVVRAQKSSSLFSEIRDVSVLTNGITVILMEKNDQLELVDEENKWANVKATALKKLLHEERRMFNLPSPEELVSDD